MAEAYRDRLPSLQCIVSYAKCSNNINYYLLKIDQTRSIQMMDLNGEYYDKWKMQHALCSYVNALEWHYIRYGSYVISEFKSADKLKCTAYNTRAALRWSIPHRHRRGRGLVQLAARVCACDLWIIANYKPLTWYSGGDCNLHEKNYFPWFANIAWNAVGKFLSLQCNIIMSYNCRQRKHHSGRAVAAAATCAAHARTLTHSWMAYVTRKRGHHNRIARRPQWKGSILLTAIIITIIIYYFRDHSHRIVCSSNHEANGSPSTTDYANGAQNLMSHMSFMFHSCADRVGHLEYCYFFIHCSRQPFGTFLQINSSASAIVIIMRRWATFIHRLRCQMLRVKHANVKLCACVWVSVVRARSHVKNRLLCLSAAPTPPFNTPG